MSNFENIYKILTESPFVGPEDKMESKKLSEISESHLKQSWKIMEKNDDFELYESKNDFGFIGGKLNYHSFKIFVDLACSEPSKNAPTFIKNSVQVEMVNTSSEFQNKGYAKTVYKSVIKRYTLISDTEQYRWSKQLWQSIAKDENIFVYIWNDSSGDFIRDSNDKPKRYNGINILEKDIFGMKDKHYKIVLVASNKELNK